MDFPLSIFAVEIDASPMIAFEAKWHADADRIGREWLDTHWNELTTKGESGIEFPPIYRLRLARASERETYRAGGNGVEYCGKVALVRLGEVGHRQDGESGTEHAAGATTEDQPPDHTGNLGKDDDR